MIERMTVQLKNPRMDDWGEDPSIFIEVDKGDERGIWSLQDFNVELAEWEFLENFRDIIDEFYEHDRFDEYYALRNKLCPYWQDDGNFNRIRPDLPLVVYQPPPENL